MQNLATTQAISKDLDTLARAEEAFGNCILTRERGLEAVRQSVAEALDLTHQIAAPRTGAVVCALAHYAHHLVQHCAHSFDDQQRLADVAVAGMIACTNEMAALMREVTLSA